MVTFDYIDKNVRLNQLAHSGKNYPKLEKNENPSLSAKVARRFTIKCLIRTDVVLSYSLILFNSLAGFVLVSIGKNFLPGIFHKGGKPDKPNDSSPLKI